MCALVSYSGSSSDDEEDNPLTVPSSSRKRCADDHREDGPDAKAGKVNDNQEVSENGLHQKQLSSLPLPGAIRGMFGTEVADANTNNDPSKHGGRVRSFPHLEGNWASYVYIPVSPDERLKAFVNQLLVCLRPLDFEGMEEFHLSLSRTVSIRHHWIQPLTESLKERFQHLDSCLCDVGALKMYTNDEKTRTFISLEVSSDETNLMEYTAAVDSSFKEFKLPAFYQNPSFHISLLWSVGDVISHIPDATRNRVEALTREFLSTNTDLSVVAVNKAYLKTGNKTFAFHLCNAHH